MAAFGVAWAVAVVVSSRQAGSAKEGDGGHVQFAGRGRYGGHDAAVLGP